MAGSILESSLVHTGWKFPYISLSLEDEKLLFDVEIKLKLHHMDAVRLLRDIVIDFPGQSLLQCPTLLRTILDELGSNCFILENFRTNSYCVSLIEIVQKIIISCDECLKLLRHDSRWYSCRSMETVNGEIQYPEQISSAIPVPSISGFAFACCAAALPLVQTQDIEVSFAVKQLFATCWRFGLESEGSLQLNAGRIQHIMNRFNQVFVSASPFCSFKQLRKLSSKKYDTLTTNSTWESCHAKIGNSLSTLLLVDIFDSFISSLLNHSLRNEYIVGQGIQHFFQSFLVNQNSIRFLYWNSVENISTFIYSICPVISFSIHSSINIANMLRNLRDYELNINSICLETWELMSENINFFCSTSPFQVKSYLNVDKLAEALVSDQTIVLRNGSQIKERSVNSLSDMICALFFYGQEDIKIALIDCISRRILSNANLSDVLITSLCSVEFVQYLCWTVLQKETPPDSAKEVNSFLCLISYCCGTEHWSVDELEIILQWITTVSWRWRDYSDHARVVDNFINTMFDSVMIRVEEIPAAWINRLLLGIFHSDSAVQTKSVELLRNVILKNRFLFHLDDTPFNLTKLPQYSSSIRPSLAKKKTFSVTHSDLRNLISAAFGSVTYAVKCAAIGQLLDNLLTDDSLLLTCDVKWVSEICKKVVESIELEIFGKSRCTCIHEFDKFRSEFCLNGIRLLRLFAMSHKSVQFRIFPVHESQSDFNCVDISILVFLVIGTDQLSLQFNKLCEGSKFVLNAFNESVKVLHTLLFCTRKWDISFRDGTISCASEAEDFQHMTMPEFLEYDYYSGAKSFESGEMANSLKFALLLKPKMKCSNLPSLPSSTIVDAAISDIEFNGSSRILIANRLSSLLITAADHWSFFRASVLLMTYLKLYHSVLGFDDILGSITEVLQKLLEKIPSTQKDRCIFLVALKLSRSLLPFCSVSLQNSIFKSANPSMMSVVEQVQLNNTGSDEANSSWLFDVTMESIRLVIALPVVAVQYLQLNSNFCGKVFEIFLKESKHSELKLMASKLVEVLLSLNICQFHNICGIRDSKDDIISPELVPLRLIINVAKLLRVPDSFQLHTTTIVSLKLVLTYLDYFETLQIASVLWESLYWQWLSRFFYHRSAEIRLLSLETAHKLLSLVENLHKSSAPSSEWPPVQQLYYLMVDETEIQIIRIKSGVLLLKLCFQSKAILTWPNEHVITKFSEIIQTGCSSISTLLEMMDGLTYVAKYANVGIESSLLSSYLLTCIQNMVNLFVDTYLQKSYSDTEQQLCFVFHCKLFKLLLSAEIGENQFGGLISNKKFVAYCQFMLEEQIFSDVVKLTSDFAMFEGISQLLITFLNNQECWLSNCKDLLGMLNSILVCIRRGLKCLINSMCDQIAGNVLEYIESCCSVLFVLVQVFSARPITPSQSDSLLSVFLSFRQLWMEFMRISSCEASIVSAKIEILLSLMIEYQLVEENALVYQQNNVVVEFVDIFINHLRRTQLWSSSKQVTKIEGKKLLRSGRWREKVRSFAVAEESSCTRFPENSLEGIWFCWSSVLLLKSALCIIMLGASREQQIEIMAFIQYGVIFAAENGFRVSMQQGMDHIKAKRDYSGKFRVSKNQLVAVIWSCFSNVVANDWIKEQFLSISSPAIIRQINSDGSNCERLIHQILSISFHDGVIESIRWLLLDACSKCLLSDQMVSPSIKLTAYQNIANSLQNALLCNVIERDVFHLLSACMVVISANPEILSNTVRHSIKHSKCPSFQDLLERVNDKSSDRVELLALTIRALGLPIAFGSDSFKSFVAQSFCMNVANLAVRSDCEILKILGSIFIWHLLQLSEKNKCIVKKRIEDISSGCSEKFSSVLIKAQFNINILLNG